jgi:Rrf2 family protein
VRFSTKGIYALEAALAMALQPDGARLSVRVIGARTGLSDSYLEQIFTLLKNGRIIRGSRGSRGGYELAADPSTITVGDILRAGEGSLAPVRCTEPGSTACIRQNDCLTRPVWSSLEKTISGFVDQITLADLARDYHQGQYEHRPDYTI